MDDETKADEILKTIEAAKLKTPSEESKNLPPIPFKFDEVKALANVDAVLLYLHTFAGKEAHNPYLVIKDKIDPLMLQFKNGVRTEALYSAMLGLKQEAPVIPLLVKNVELRKAQEADKKPNLNFPPRA